MPLPDFERADELPGEGQETETHQGEESEQSIEEKLTKVGDRVEQRLQAGLQQNAQMIQTLSDPDVQEVLRRKQQGRPVKVIDAEPDAEPEPNFEEMDQKTLVQYLGKQNQKLVTQTVQEAIAPLIQQFGGMQQVVRSSLEEKAQQQVAAAAQKYVDFDSYRSKMAELAQRYGDATPDELYVMACMRAGKQPQLRQAVQDRSRLSSSERPSHTTARPSAAKIPAGMSRREAMQFALSNALKNIDTTGLEQE